MADQSLQYCKENIKCELIWVSTLWWESLNNGLLRLWGTGPTQNRTKCSCKKTVNNWAIEHVKPPPPGWQKLHGRTGRIRQKVWTRTKISSPNIRYFVTIYTLFGDLWAKKVPFWVKNSVSWARSALLHGLYCILYWIKFANLQLRAKMTHLWRK